MRHQRQGWSRLVALPVALLGALVVAPGLALASPSSVGNTILAITNCKASITVSWVAQPGKYKTFTVEISSNADASLQSVGSGVMGRSGSPVFQKDLASFGFSNQFHAVTHVFDGKGVEQQTWYSAAVEGSCI